MAKNAKAEEAFALYKQGLKLIDIATKLDVPVGTVRSWKNRNKWDADATESGNATQRVKKCNVAKKRKIAKEVESVIDNPDLTDKQRMFCLNYVRCFNATKAYQKAYGCKYDTARAEGYKHLANPCIKEEIHRLKQDRLNREFLSESDIFQKYMDIAFADLTDYVEFGTEEVPVMGMYGPVEIKDPVTGKKKNLTEIINVVRFKSSDMVDGTILSEIKQGKDNSIKLNDRMKALSWLADHMDLATEEQKAKIAVMRAKVQTDDSTEIADDGFLAALNGSAVEDWADEEDT